MPTKKAMTSVNVVTLTATPACLIVRPNSSGRLTASLDVASSKGEKLVFSCFFPLSFFERKTLKSFYQLCVRVVSYPTTFGWNKILTTS